MRLIDVDNVDYENIMCSQSQLHWLNAILEKQPTVDAVPVVHGQWLPTNDPDKKRCSRCDVIHKIAQYPRGAIDWCPNCGAKMDGDSHENL